ncbi:uncharacterized protein METZ01_LOCUS263746, partial [marine metagenome]
MTSLKSLSNHDSQRFTFPAPLKGYAESKYLEKRTIFVSEMSSQKLDIEGQINYDPKF